MPVMGDTPITPEHSVDTQAPVTSVAAPDHFTEHRIRHATSDLALALDELEAARPAYATAEEYYEDRRPEVFASQRMRRAMSRTSTAFHLGFARKPVDVISERLRITSITTNNPEASKAVAALIKRNKLWRHFKNWFTRAGEYGDAYVMVWPATSDDDDADITDIDIFYHSPFGCRVFYDPENPNVVKFVVKRWYLAGTKQVRVNLQYPDRIEKYVTKPGVIHPTASDLQRYYDDDNEPDPNEPDGRQWPLPNPFGITMFHLRNDEPYGRPEHYGFYGAQDVIRKLIVTHMASVDYHGFPQRWALADLKSDPLDLEADDEDMEEFALGDTGGTRNNDGDPQSQLSADPASLWLLRGYKSVGQFPAADPKVFTDPMTLYLRFGAMLTETPLNRIDPTGAVQSGESRRADNESFHTKVRDRASCYGDTIVAIFECALRMLGFPDVEVQVNWAPVETIDDEQGWQVLLLKLKAGLPVRQAFVEAGYSHTQVEDWFPDEDRDLPVRVELLLKIGQALAALTPAMGANMISDDQVQDLITTVMGEWVDTGGPRVDPGDMTRAD